jgi:hypothetical protein
MNFIFVLLMGRFIALFKREKVEINDWEKNLKKEEL